MIQNPSELKVKDKADHKVQENDVKNGTKFQNNKNLKDSKSGEPTTGKKNSKKKLSAKALTYTTKLMRNFRPLGVYIKAVGGQPFEVVTAESGTQVYIFKPVSLNSSTFFLTSIFSLIIFVLLSLGLMGIFLWPNLDHADRCGQSWETTMFARHIVPVFLTWSWLGLTAACGLFIFFHGKSYSRYFSFWNKAVQKMEMDVTGGARSVGWLSNLDVFILFTIFITLFFSPETQSLNDANRLIVHSIARVFGNEIYSETTKRGTSCTAIDSCYWWTLFGFIVHIYSLFASRSFIIQFRFFSRMLRNACHIWNTRLNCALAHVHADEENQEKRRLDLKLILGDHLTIVQLFKMTDSTFRLILQCFYTAVTVNLCFEMYYLSRLSLGSINACEQLPKFNTCVEGLIHTLENSVLSISLIVQSIYLFVSVTLEGANAYQEAMRGFRVLLRYGFMFYKSRNEINLVHSLGCSFAPNNPIQISYGRYFNISRPLIITVTSTMVTYFILVLQFRPSAIGVQCI